MLLLVGGSNSPDKNELFVESQSKSSHSRMIPGDRQDAVGGI